MKSLINLASLAILADADIFSEEETKLSDGSLSRSDSALSCEDPEKFQVRVHWGLGLANPLYHESPKLENRWIRKPQSVNSKISEPQITKIQLANPKLQNPNDSLAMSKLKN